MDDSSPGTRYPSKTEPHAFATAAPDKSLSPSKPTPNSLTRHGQPLSPLPLHSSSTTSRWKLIVAVTGAILSCALLATGLGIIFGGIIGLSTLAAYCMTAIGVCAAVGFSTYATSSLIRAKKPKPTPMPSPFNNSSAPRVDTENVYSSAFVSPESDSVNTRAKDRPSSSSSSSSDIAFSHLVKPPGKSQLDACCEDDADFEAQSPREFANMVMNRF